VATFGEGTRSRRSCGEFRLRPAVEEVSDVRVLLRLGEAQVAHGGGGEDFGQNVARLGRRDATGSGYVLS
jgi:hypothetical protein